VAGSSAASKTVNKLVERNRAAKGLSTAPDVDPVIKKQADDVVDKTNKAIDAAAVPQDKSVHAPGDSLRQQKETITAATKADPITPADLTAAPSNIEVATANQQMFTRPAPGDMPEREIIQQVAESAREDLERVLAKNPKPDKSGAELEEELASVEAKSFDVQDKIMDAADDPGVDTTKLYNELEKLTDRGELIEKQLTNLSNREMAQAELKKLDADPGALNNLPERYRKVAELEIARSRAKTSALSRPARTVEPTLEPVESVEAVSAVIEPTMEGREALVNLRNNPDGVVIDETGDGTVTRMSAGELADEFDELDAIERAMTKCQ
jgi:hypothetical protein